VNECKSCISNVGSWVCERVVYKNNTAPDPANGLVGCDRGCVVR